VQERFPLLRNDHRTQGRLLLTGTIFIGFSSIALTIAPAVRARSFDVDYRWEHWAGTLVWSIGFWILHQLSKRFRHNFDPILLPIVALMSGWGLLSIWRLSPTFGLRQTIWLTVSLIVFTICLGLPSNLSFLRRYKYLWLTGGLLLTALTLIFGTNPMGFGPRLWLGCCGIYLQPSEPLKLLLIIYLSAYFAEWSGVLTSKNPALPGLRNSRYLRPQIRILVPTLIMTGLALLLLFVQRDLGTAFIFIFLYSVMVFLVTGWLRVPFIMISTLFGAGFLGYWFYDVIRLRVDAWINPWQDPIGRSYQIVQSLLAVANGGIFGRGPGLGSPSLVPVAHSDFIFASIAEEYGLVGVMGFLLLVGLLTHCGLRIAIQTTDNFRRYLAAGITAFLVGQSVLIIGGNLRLLPLTGVTLPFVSYGGSSLLVSFLIALLLFQTSTSSIPDDWMPIDDQQPTQIFTSPTTTATLRSSIYNLSGFLLVTLVATSLVAGWWAYVRGPDLLTRTDNPRRAIADRSVSRGRLFDRNEIPIVETVGEAGEFVRVVRYPQLGSIIGYSHPTYGQSGLEASLDPILRGIQGNDSLTIWWNHILYGQPPPGLDIRLTLDIDLQATADELLSGYTGTLILLNAETGEILVMGSHPTFDPNDLEDQWDDLVQDPQAPLLNRATQGRYPTGDLAQMPFIQAGSNPDFGTISFRLPLAETAGPEESTPLEIALAAATLSNAGVRPAPSIARLMRIPEGSWQLIPAINQPQQIVNPQSVDRATQILSLPDAQVWQIVSTPFGQDITWFIGGTSQEWSGLPLAIAVVLEEVNIPLAEEIGQAVLSAAMGP
jgi:cell division protein FtsW (lipid II flippase)